MNKAIKFSISVEGNTYPCVLSMGASLDYFEATGREVHETATGNQLLTLIFFCAAAGAALQGKKLPFDANTFRHHLTPVEGAAVVDAYVKAVQAAGAEPDADADADADGDSKKKE